MRQPLTRILVLGGGSGQTVRTLLESPSIKHIQVVEIDALLVDACRRYIKGAGQAFRDRRVKLLIGDAFEYLHSTIDRFDAVIIDLTERPFGFRNNAVALKRLYAHIKQKCKGRCSQYVGSSVGLAYSPWMRSLAGRVSRQFLSNVRFEDVFIPSFGAPHTFMHAGYET